MGEEQARGTSPVGARIEIRPCHALEEFNRCIELERQVWDCQDIDLTPLPVYIVAAHSGGQVFGAYVGAEMVGFILATPGYRDDRPLMYSHMAAVLPAYQGQGVGWQLKLYQRADALARGMELVEWTFDPLEIRNAYFNLERLGVVIRRYSPNLFGRTTSPLHGQLPTDRLWAEWWLRTARVEAAVAGQPWPKKPDAKRIRIPGNIGELRQKDLTTAQHVLNEVREQFTHWLNQGYAAIGFERDARGGGTYLLEPYEG